MTDLLTKSSPPASSGEDDVRQYLSDIRAYPRLTPEEERLLAQGCAAGDKDAIRKMVNCNLRLVVSVAREYAGRGVPLMDLIQEGSIGLLVAAKKFDYTREVRFSTYATKWIRQRVTRYLQNHAELIRVPVYTAERIRKVADTRAALLQQKGQEPTEEELAEACQMEPEQLRKLMQLHPEICSIDAPLTEGEDGTVGALLENVQSPQPYEALVREELNQTMETMLQSLNDRQRQVLRLYFGMEDGACHSLEQIGCMLGVSKERARQIKQQALDKLLEMGSGMGLEEYLE